jgi:hypothetical protein
MDEGSSFPLVSTSVASLGEQLVREGRGDVTAFEIVRELLMTHPTYGGGPPGRVHPLRELLR